MISMRYDDHTVPITGFFLFIQLQIDLIAFEQSGYLRRDKRLCRAQQFQTIGSVS